MKKNHLLSKILFLLLLSITLTTTVFAGFFTRTFMFVGDLCFTGAMQQKIIVDPNYPWMGVKEILSKASLLVGNLEAPLSNQGEPYIQKTWILRGDPRTAQTLQAGKFHAVTLANNHMMDYGQFALEDTLNILDELKIAHTGAGMNQFEAAQPVMLHTSNWVKVALLSYSFTYPEIFWATAKRPGVAHALPKDICAAIKAAKTHSKYVIVTFHWGKEMEAYASGYQHTVARQCIDAGASIVIGHHPHVLQGIEVYHGGLIAYSLGNFAFGSYAKNCTDSMIFAVDYDHKGLLQAKIYPVNVNNYQVHFQTRLRYGADAHRVLNHLQTISKKYHTQIKIQDDLGIIELRK